jgi:hypothetical protein
MSAPLPSPPVSPYPAAMVQKSPQTDRKERLAAALRENLKRRKAQMRRRAESETTLNVPADTHSQDGVGDMRAPKAERR